MGESTDEYVVVIVVRRKSVGRLNKQTLVRRRRILRKKGRQRIRDKAMTISPEASKFNWVAHVKTQPAGSIHDSLQRASHRLKVFCLPSYTDLTERSHGEATLASLSSGEAIAHLLLRPFPDTLGDSGDRERERESAVGRESGRIVPFARPSMSTILNRDIRICAARVDKS